MEREKWRPFCRYFSIKEMTGARWGMLLGKARTIGAYPRIGKKSPPIKFPSPYFREWSVYAGGQSLSCTVLPQNRIARNDCEQREQTSPAGIYCYQPCSILHAVFPATKSSDSPPILGIERRNPALFSTSYSMWQAARPGSTVPGSPCISHIPGVPYSKQGPCAD